jgi:hypothetical protein
VTLLWFVGRELLSRRGRAYGAVLVVASVVALSVTVELVSRAREAAVGLQLTAVGPALRVLPAGVTASSLVEDAPDRPRLPPGTVERVRRAAGTDLASLEQRTVVWMAVSGRRSHVIGVEPGAEGLPALRPHEVALGAFLASALHADPETIIDIHGEPFQVVAVLPTRADSDDAAAFLRLEHVRGWLASADGTSEIRLQLRHGVDPATAAARLAVTVPGVSVARPDRGAVVEGEAQGVLATHRHLVWWITGVVSLVCLGISSHLDALERRREVAMLVAIGAAGHEVAVAGMLRSAALGATGGAIGFALGAAATAALDVTSAWAVLPALSLAVSSLGATTIVGIVAGLPTGAAAALRDPVADLQDV